MSPTPTPVTSVVVGDDGSDGAAAAVGWARRVAGLADARVVLVRATGAEAEPVRPSTRMTASAGEDSRTVAGPPVGALLGAVEDLNPDLLIVGRRGAGGFEGLRLGSTAHQLAEHSPVPVAVVSAAPANSPPAWPISRIVVGVDGSEPARTALRWAGRMAALAAASVSVAHAAEFGAAFAAAGVHPTVYRSSLERRRVELDGWSRTLAEAGVGYETVIEEGGPAGVILHTAEVVGAQLVVVGRRGEGGLSGLAMGSAAHRVIAFAPCPTVVVPSA